MPSVKLSVPHRLGQEEASARLKRFFVRLKNRYQNQLSDLEEKWSGHDLDFGFKTYGFHVSGRMSVEPEEVRFDGQIPLAAMMFKGKIEQTVRDELNKLLGDEAKPA